MDPSEKQQMFRNRLTKVYRHLSKQAKRQGISCYRVYDRDIPEFPFSVDIYEDKLYVAEYKTRHGMTDDEHEEWLEHGLATMEEILAIPKDRIFVKQRQRKPGRQGQYQKIGESAVFYVAREGGLKFKVNLSDYLDTGLFLDHRVTREIVRSESSNKKVLNLFAYTGSFSVYAAAGGASMVTTVDLSKTYLNWAMENMKLNGFTDPDKYRFVQADVKQFLKESAGGLYDLVIMDPPTFSNSKRMKNDFLEIQRDHVELINDALLLMPKGGVLFFSTNFIRFVLDREKLHADQIRDISKATTAFDFEGRSQRYCWKIWK